MNTKTLFAQYGSDPKLEVEGKWLDFEASGIRVLLARAGGSNNAFRAAEAKFVSVHGSNIAEMPPEEFGELLAEVYGHHVVMKIEGEGFVDEDGNPMESNPETHTAILRALPDFFEEIRMISRERSTFRRERDKAVAGN